MKKVEKIKISELMVMDIDIDVVDDYDERCYIAFSGGMALKPEGMKKFGHMLDKEIECYFDGNFWQAGVIHCETAKEATEAKRFFESMAGLCSADDWEQWFEILE